MLQRLRRPARAGLFLALAVVAALAGGLLVGGRATSAHAAAIGAPGGTAVSTVDAFALEGFQWTDRTTVDVYYNWDGGTCVVNGRDMSGPALALSQDLAKQELDLSIQEINRELRGGLTLVDAGPTTRADLCSTNPGHAIVVGWGSIASTGLTLNFGIQTSALGASTFTAARVFLDDTYNFACPDSPTYRDLQHVFSHELLHAIGVGHSTDPNALMAPTGVACQMGYLLTSDDIAAIAALYPPVLPAPAPVVTATPAPTPAATVAPTPVPTATPVPSVTTAPIASGTDMGQFDRPIASVGVNTALWGGGSVTELATATQSSGGRSITVYLGGRAVIYIPGAPAFVNAAFLGAYPVGVPSATIVLIVR